MKESVYSFLIKSLTALITFLAPVGPSVAAVGFLVFVDFIFGILVARKNNIPIQSKEMKKTLVKMLIYQSMVLTGFIMDKYFIPWEIVAKVCMLGIGTTELKSVAENFEKLTGVGIWNLLKDKLHAMASSNTKTILNQPPPESDDKKDPPAPTA